MNEQQLPVAPGNLDPSSALASQKVSDPRRDALEMRLTRLLAAPMERTSWGGCRRTGARLGLLVYHGLNRRSLATRNVQTAFPRLSERQANQIARRSVQNMAMLLCEFLHLRVATPREISEYAIVDDLGHVEAGFEQGRGVLLLTAHFGNWEVMGARVVQSFPMTVMIRPTSNASFQAYIESIRRRVGMKMISKHATARTSLKVLRANESLAIFPDQYDTKGTMLPLFGHPTRMVSSFARLAVMSQAPMIPGFGVRRTPWLADGRIRIHIEPGLYLHQQQYDSREEAVMAGTRWTVTQIENIVTQYPDQWLWLHRRWRDADRVHAAATAP